MYAAQTGAQAYRREPEQVQVPAARRGPAKQAVGEDAEQVKGQDELMGSHEPSLLAVVGRYSR